MKRKHKGMTLVEVIVAMVLMSIVAVTFVTSMSGSFSMIFKGKEITVTSFELQGQMENEMVNAKSVFLKNQSDITVFGGTPFAKSLEVMHLNVPVNATRAFDAYVTNVSMLQMDAPVISNFEVDVFVRDTTTRAFPWIEDDIEFRATYRMGTNPAIYQFRTRWYSSNNSLDPGENILWNPVFSSQYNIHGEQIRDATALTVVDKYLKAQMQPERFYYFELMPYTAYGKIAYKKNDHRIPVLNKTSNVFWNQLIENAYFNPNLYKVNYPDSEVFVEVLNNSKRATLHVDSTSQTNRAGSQAAFPLASSNFVQMEISLKAQVDPGTLSHGATGLGYGVLFGTVTSKKDTGHMIEFDPINDTIALKYVVDGVYAYEANHVLVNNVSTFLNNTDFTLDWTKENVINIHFDKGIKEFRVFITDLSGNMSEHLVLDAVSNPMALLPFSGNFIGLKSFSSYEYKPTSVFDVVTPYFRNYATHFYDLRFNGRNFPEPPPGINPQTDGYWTQGNSHVIDNSNPKYGGIAYDTNTNILKPYRFKAPNSAKLGLSNGSDWFRAFAFYLEGEGLDVSNGSTLRLASNDIIFNLPVYLAQNNANMIFKVIDQPTLTDTHSNPSVVVTVPQSTINSLFDGSVIGGVSGKKYGRVYFTYDVFIRTSGNTYAVLIPAGNYYFPNDFNVLTDYNKTPQTGGLIPF